MHRIRTLKVRSVVLAMFLTLAASALFQISTYRNARLVEEIGSRDGHVRDVLTALAALRSAVQDAVIRRDGYLLTGERRDLQSFRDAAAGVPGLLGQVRALTADDPAQAEGARQLPPLIDDELADPNPGPPAPRPAPRPAPGQPGSFRTIIDRMTDEGQRARSACVARTRVAASAQARLLVIASVYRVFVLLAGCTLILRQQARQRRTEQLCRRSEEFFRNAFDHAATGMALADEGGRWLKVNRALCELVGYPEDELLRIGARSITHREDPEREGAAAEELRSGRADRRQFEMRYVHRGGHTVWALVTQSLVRDERGCPQTLISQIQDVTERKRAEDRLRHQSLHDALTGLPNRLLLDDRLRRGIVRANREPDFRMALLFLDLDRFKLINDSLGHAAGDELLIAVADRLRRCVRGGDPVAGNGGAGSAGGADCPGHTPKHTSNHTVARLGGDEFTVLLEGLRAPGDAERVAERILRELAEPTACGGRQIGAAASIGIVHAAPGRYAAAPELLADADAALYQAKAAGRGRYAVFDADARQAERRQSAA